MKFLKTFAWLLLSVAGAAKVSVAINISLMNAQTIDATTHTEGAAREGGNRPRPGFAIRFGS
jgi:hypothetical protein